MCVSACLAVCLSLSLSISLCFSRSLSQLLFLSPSCPFGLDFISFYSWFLLWARILSIGSAVPCVSIGFASGIYKYGKQWVKCQKVILHYSRSFISWWMLKHIFLFLPPICYFHKHSGDGTSTCEILIASSIMFLTNVKLAYFRSVQLMLCCFLMLVRQSFKPFAAITGD